MSDKTIVGLDVGYGYTKAFDGRRAVVFPSLLGAAVTIRYSNDLITNGRGLQIDNYFVGELARKQSPSLISPLARNRDLEIVRILALAALHQIGGREQVTLVTGLPVSWYQDKERLVEILLGTHTYTTGGEDESTVTIEQVHVVPQPFGSLFRALISPEGRVTDPEGLATCKVGVLDIGTHTTDAILSDHLTYVEVHSGSIPVATGQLYDLVRRAVADRYDLELTRPEIADVVETGKATAFGKQINARHLVDEARDSVARQVVAFAQTLWGDAKTYATIILTGGGGVYFEPQVRAAFPHAHLAAEAQLANAQGFYRYGALKAR